MAPRWGGGTPETMLCAFHLAPYHPPHPSPFPHTDEMDFIGIKLQETSQKELSKCEFTFFLFKISNISSVLEPE